MNAASHRLRSKSPFQGRGDRRERSKSPFGGDKRSALKRTKSPFRLGRKSIDTTAATAAAVPLVQYDSEGNELHGPEINVFQQLCLDKHDDSAAIEILLEDTHGDSIPDLYTTSTESTDKTPPAVAASSPWRRAGGGGSAERKRDFLNRIFKSPRKGSTSATPLNGIKHEPLPNGITSDLNPPVPKSHLPFRKTHGKNYESSFRPKKPPSANSRSNIPDAVEGDKHSGRSSKQQRQVLSEKIDTFSNMSSLSGTRASGSLRRPINLNRQESMGMDSIKDIRTALKEMEKSLGAASTSGHRISREKVMRALFTVADSLEDTDERAYLRRELEGQRQRHQTTGLPMPVAEMDEEDEDDDDDDDDEEDNDGVHYDGVGTQDYIDDDDADGGDKSETTSEEHDEDEDDFSPSTSEDDSGRSQDQENSSPPFNFFSSVSRLFTVSADDKKKVDQALDDLLWTEFIEARKAGLTPGSDIGNGMINPSQLRKGSKKKKQQQQHRSKKHRHRNTKRENDNDSTQQVTRYTGSRQDVSTATRSTGTRNSSQRQHDMYQKPSENQQVTANSGSHHARRHMSPRSQSEAHLSNRARSWWRRHPTSLGNTHVPDISSRDQDLESELSDEIPKYLPTSITVRGRETTRSAGTGTRPGSRNRQLPPTTHRAGRYRVRMVDTASRQGYEMSSMTSSTKHSPL